MSLTKYHIARGAFQGLEKRQQKKALTKATQISYYQGKITRNMTILNKLTPTENPKLFKDLTEQITKDDDKLRILMGVEPRKEVKPPPKDDKDASTIIADVGKKAAIGTGAVEFFNRNLAWVPDPVEVFGLGDKSRAVTKVIAEKAKSELKQLKQDPEQFFKDIQEVTEDVGTFAVEVIDDIFNWGKRQVSNTPTVIGKEKTEDDQGNPLVDRNVFEAYGQSVKKLLD